MNQVTATTVSLTRVADELVTELPTCGACIIVWPGSNLHWLAADHTTSQTPETISSQAASSALRLLLHVLVAEHGERDTATVE